MQPHTAEGAQRRKEAIDLRVAGWTFARIGAELGVSGERARQLVDEELERLAAERQAGAHRLRDLELRRLDRYLDALEPNIEKGDTKAIEAAVKVGVRRAKLLGIDAPEQRDVTVRADDVTPEKARAVMADLFGSQAAPKANGASNGANGHGHGANGNGAAEPPHGPAAA